jgi:hypothetical protein
MSGNKGINLAQDFDGSSVSPSDILSSLEQSGTDDILSFFQNHHNLWNLFYDIRIDAERNAVGDCLLALIGKQEEGHALQILQSEHVISILGFFGQGEKISDFVTTLRSNDAVEDTIKRRELPIRTPASAPA